MVDMNKLQELVTNGVGSKVASKAPKRVKRLSMVLLVCFMLIYVVVIGQTLLSSLGGLFG